MFSSTTCNSWVWNDLKRVSDLISHKTLWSWYLESSRATHALWASSSLLNVKVHTLLNSLVTAVNLELRVPSLSPSHSCSLFTKTSDGIFLRSNMFLSIDPLTLTQSVSGSYLSRGQANTASLMGESSSIPRFNIWGCYYISFIAIWLSAFNLVIK